MHAIMKKASEFRPWGVTHLQESDFRPWDATHLGMSFAPGA